MLRMTQNQNVCLTNTVTITVSSVARLSRNGLGTSAQHPYLGKRPEKPTLLPAETGEHAAEEAATGRKPVAAAPANCPAIANAEAQADQQYLPSSDSRWSSLAAGARWSDSPRVVNRDMMTPFMRSARHQGRHQRITGRQTRT